MKKTPVDSCELAWPTGVVPGPFEAVWRETVHRSPET